MWFTQAEVPDTPEGRFAVLATVLALMIVRLEQAGADGESASVALTERTVESLDAELRQMGLNDPALGRQVRALLGALALRVERWRVATGEAGSWTSTVVRSVYRDRPVGAGALAQAESAARELWRRLLASSDKSLIDGELA